MYLSHIYHGLVFTSSYTERFKRFMKALPDSHNVQSTFEAVFVALSWVRRTSKRNGNSLSSIDAGPNTLINDIPAFDHLFIQWGLISVLAHVEDLNRGGEKNLGSSEGRDYPALGLLNPSPIKGIGIYCMHHLFSSEAFVDDLFDAFGVPLAVLPILYLPVMLSLCRKHVVIPSQTYTGDKAGDGHLWNWAQPSVNTLTHTQPHNTHTYTHNLLKCGGEQGTLIPIAQQQYLNLSQRAR